MKFGNELKYQREIAGLTQSELARKTGIAQATISRWEDDLRIPNIENCLLLANLYGISIDELIGRDTIPNKKSAVVYNNSTHNGNNNF